MRFDVHNLAQLRDAVDLCSEGDRIVLFIGVHTIRFRVLDDSLEWHECTPEGRLLECEPS